MQAIETEYRGYRFRSRLEARWAVYLDAIGWPWEFEPEGFELSQGLRYLPDFHVSDPCGVLSPWWLEIKPTLDLSEREWAQLLTFENLLYRERLAGRASEKFALVVGTPDPEQCGYFPPSVLVDLVWIVESPDFDPSKLRGVRVKGELNINESTVFWDCCPGSDAKHRQHARAARSARFEFGASGASAATRR